MLRLRALRTCGDFDDYWTFHLREELRRNHAERYADIVLAVPVSALEGRPGGTISGPSLVKVADVAAWLLLIALNGLRNVMAFTVQLNMNFLRPAALGPLSVRATLLGRTQRIATIATSIRAVAEAEPIAYASLTYSVPRTKEVDVTIDFPLSQEDLAPIVGVYRFEGPLENRRFEVFSTDGRVQMVEVDAESGRRIGTVLRLTPRSTSDFEAVEFDAQLTFLRAADGSVTGLSQVAFGQTFTARRLRHVHCVAGPTAASPASGS